MVSKTTDEDDLQFTIHNGIVGNLDLSASEDNIECPVLLDISYNSKGLWELGAW